MSYDYEKENNKIWPICNNKIDYHSKGFYHDKILNIWICREHTLNEILKVVKLKDLELIKFICDYEGLEYDYIIKVIYGLTMDKKFLCYYGHGYEEKGVKVVNETFFNEDNGYEKEQIKQVNNLQIGEMLDLSERETHIIVRGKDEEKESVEVRE